ncbi:hypothetical protein [Dyella sp. 2RAB6]|uniref:hypothetical protein n=1 Tax=Dyella sp. 2RAB6 TaxID=3232992 RepID=UPI003F8EAF3F
MKMDRKYHPGALAPALICLALAAFPDARAQSPSDTPTQGSLCPAGQTTLFACSSGQKQIAVCGKPGNDTYDELRYRYGTERNLEADFPNEAEPVPPRLFASGNRASNGAGGTLNYLHLSDGRTRFTVFSETSSPGGYESSGVLVENRGHSETHLCDGQTPGQVEGLSDPKLIGKAVPRDERVPEGFPTYQVSPQPTDQASPEPSAQPSPGPAAQPSH